MTNAGPLKLTPLGLAEYRERIRHLSMPSLIQAHAFAKKISGAHSWYKHLDVTEGYDGLVFYLDPNAGQDVWWDEQEGMRIVAREPDETPLHYSWITTASAIEQFGHLNYCRNRTSDPDRSNRVTATPWIADGQQVFTVPAEVLEATRVGCSALLHPHSQSLGHVVRLPNFRKLVEVDIGSGRYKPQEIRLMEIIRTCNEDIYQSYSLQEEYAGIVASIREKQLSEIVKAIDRLRDLLS